MRNKSFFDMISVRKSIKNKIVYVVMAIFLVTVMGIFVFSNFRLRAIISEEKVMDFSERIRVIIRALDKQEAELRKTGLVDTYKDFFQDKILADLREAYYSKDDLSIYPYILDKEGLVIMHPTLEKESAKLRYTPLMTKVLEKKEKTEGDIAYFTPDEDTRRWGYYRWYNTWDWLIVYSMDEAVKYSSVNQYITGLTLTLVVSGFLMILFIIVTFNIILKPLYDTFSIIQYIEDSGQLNKRIKINSTDEIGLLQRGINSMMDKIEELQVAAISHARNEREMEIAATLQTSLLPDKMPVGNFDIATKMITADSVGGDYYDVIKVNDRDWLIIGDVSGHGVNAGVIMMMVQTSIHLVLDQYPDISPKELLDVVNRTLTRNIRKLGDPKYMTITVLTYIEDRYFLYSGMHLPMMIYRAKTRKVDLIHTVGMWIGLIDDISDVNKNEQFSIESGDCLLLYTDGITEAREGELGPMFGQPRLQALFAENGGKSSNEILDIVIKSLEGYECDDDVSLVVVKKL